MKILRSITEMAYHPQTVITIGTFDGVHRGHVAILQDTIHRARTISGRAVVVTFDPHPREVVGKGPVGQLCTLDERLELFARIGIDETLVIQFTYEFSQMTARTFYEEYLVKQIGVHHVVIGHDHQFGRNREGSIETLHQLGTENGFQVTVIEGIAVNDKIVSSSLIRRCLEHGDVDHAATYLGRPHAITAEVIEGDKRGRQLGFPTANLNPETVGKMMPASGVYVVKAITEGKTEYGMLNIGVRPTFQSSGQLFIEVHLLDFSGNLYGKKLNVSFLKRLRSEKKFNSIDDLVAQLHQDRSDTKQFVSTIH